MRSMPGLALLLLLSGCLQGTPHEPSGGGIVAGTTAPFRLDFGAPQVVSPGVPILNTGEPYAAFLPDGRLLVTFTGCDRMPAGTGLMLDESACYHSPLLRSRADGGWDRLGSDDRLVPDAPASQGDATIDVAPDGTAYHSFMTADGFELLRSDDAGDSWTRLPPIAEGDRDRQFLAIAADGSLLITYRGELGLLGRVSVDRGQTWGAPQVLATDYTSNSAGAWRPDCGGAFLVYTAPKSEGRYDVLLGRSSGAGPWEVDLVAADIPSFPATATEIEARPGAERVDMARPKGFPSLAIAPDCTPFVAWSQHTAGALGQDEGGGQMMVATPQETGWAVRAQDLGEDAIMPWIQADATKVVVAAYARAGAMGVYQTSQWAMLVGVVRHDLLLDDVLVIDAGINGGDICTANPNCVPTDRSVLDHLHLAVAPDGRMAVAYVAQPPTEGLQKTIRVAVSG
jgi:hypothetical protein